MSFPSTKGTPAAGFAGRSIDYQEVLFTESGAGTYTAKVPVPAGATVLDVLDSNQALWGAATSAALIVGDDVTNNCFLASTNLKTTPAIDDTAVEGSSSLVTSSGKSKRYPDGGNVVATITSVGAGTTGRTTVGVVMLVPFSEITPVKS